MLSMSYAASVISTSHASGVSRWSVSTCGVRSAEKSARSVAAATDAPLASKRGSRSTT